MINSRVRAADAGRHQTARILEHVGVIALAVVLMVAVAFAGWGTELRSLTGQLTCAVTPGPDCSGPPAPAHR